MERYFPLESIGSYAKHNEVILPSNIQGTMVLLQRQLSQ